MRVVFISRSYLWKGQYKCILRILGSSFVLFSNSDMETRTLRQRFVSKTKCIAVSNAVDADLFSFNKTAGKDSLLVLCVARIEGNKNQINLIRALNNTGYNAYYCDPGSPASILHAVRKAAAAESPEKLHRKILWEYTWPKTAKTIAEAYHQIIFPHEHPHRSNRVKRYSESLRGI